MGNKKSDKGAESQIDDGEIVKPAESESPADLEEKGGGDAENEFNDCDDTATQDVQELESKEPKSRNAAYLAMLKKEAEKAKKLKKRKGSGLVEVEADGEEEDDDVNGLEDFGFLIHKKKKDDDDEEDEDKLDEDDLKHVVDDLSDDGGDEEAGKSAIIAMTKQEEKERHEEMLHRMRDGYDDRRGGARGMHRFDQFVAADNREDAKRLGLLNEDELDSDDDGEEKEHKDNGDPEIEDENALLDKMLKDRFLHRSSVEMEEEFSDDEEPEEETFGDGEYIIKVGSEFTCKTSF